MGVGWSDVVDFWSRSSTAEVLDRDQIFGLPLVSRSHYSVDRSLGAMPASELIGLRPVVALPLGSCEQHGPHLPLDTDTRIAVELTHRLAAARPSVVAAPALAFGASWEHAGFPGLLSLDHDVLTALVVQLARSADWAAGLMLVNGHGGNHLGVRRAVDQLTGEGRCVVAWSPSLPIPGVVAPEGLVDDLHAGWVETSVMLALDPSAVDMSAAPVDSPSSVDRRRLVQSGVRSVSASGVLGDPRQATVAAGDAILRAWLDDLVGAFDRASW